MPRGPHHHDGQSAVEVRREDYEAKWKVVHEAKWNAARARRTEAGKEDRTKGSAAGQLSGRLLRRFLEMAAHSLGDQRLVEAVEAVKFWKLDKKPYRSLRVAFNDRCLVQIDQLFLYGNGERSLSTILEACEYFVAEHGLGSPTTTFEREVARLRRAWMRSGRSIPQL
jgi:hypothetical protein